jgi:hypothetical protein
MRDYIRRKSFENRAPRNPTQNRYTRFVLKPDSDLTSSFTESIKEFNASMKRGKTIYEKLIGGKI